MSASLVASEKILDEDLQRFRYLHSWYKNPSHESMLVCPLLCFGQQPRQPINPDVNENYKDDLRWWYVIEPTKDSYETLFKDEANFIWDASQKYACNIKLGKLGGGNDEKIMDLLTKQSKCFEVATKKIYQKIKEQRKK